MFKDASEQVGDYADGFWETIRELNNRESLKPMGFLRDHLSEIPHVRTRFTSDITSKADTTL